MAYCKPGFKVDWKLPRLETLWLTAQIQKQFPQVATDWQLWGVYSQLAFRKTLNLSLPDVTIPLPDRLQDQLRFELASYVSVDLGGYRLGVLGFAHGPA